MNYPPTPQADRPTANETEELRLLIAGLTNLLPAVLRTLEAMDAAIARMESQPRTDATIYWRDERYMYLIHPTAGDGTRQREYVGTDPAKQTAAHAALANFKACQQAQADQAAYLQHIRQANAEIWTAIKLLKSKPAGW